MLGSSDLTELRRRVHTDPSSLAFARLAEQLRREGQPQQAVDLCLSGLAMHPTYVSARVTLGRALLDLGEVAEARLELEAAIGQAPHNLAALKALAEARYRNGDFAEASRYHTAAEAQARNGPPPSRRPTSSAPLPARSPDPVQSAAIQPDPARERALRIVAALEGWLAAIHVPRLDQHP